LGYLGRDLKRAIRLQRKDTGELGTLTGDNHGDYTAVKWDKGGSSWIRAAMLRLIEVQLS
jgi:hypothetical protein